MVTSPRVLTRRVAVATVVLGTVAAAITAAAWNLRADPTTTEPGTLEWRPLPLPSLSPRLGAAVAVGVDAVIIHGGAPAQGESDFSGGAYPIVAAEPALDSGAIFSPQTSRWVSLPSSPVGLRGHAAVFTDSGFTFVGGHHSATYVDHHTGALLLSPSSQWASVRTSGIGWPEGVPAGATNVGGTVATVTDEELQLLRPDGTLESLPGRVSGLASDGEALIGWDNRQSTNFRYLTPGPASWSSLPRSSSSVGEVFVTDGGMSSDGSFHFVGTSISGATVVGSINPEADTLSHLRELPGIGMSEPQIAVADDGTVAVLVPGSSFTVLDGTGGGPPMVLPSLPSLPLDSVVLTSPGGDGFLLVGGLAWADQSSRVFGLVQEA